MVADKTDAAAPVKTVVAELSEEAKAKEAAIEAWFDKHFKGNIISAREEIYNLCHAAKEELKKIL